MTYKVVLVACAICASNACTVVCEARVWYVTPDGTGDAPTIQAAIDSATAGDEVVLAPGTYTRTTQGDNGVAFTPSMIEMKAGVNLRGEMGPEVTVLDGEGLPPSGYGTRIIWCQDVGAIRIEGLTITGGRTSAYGGGGIAAIGNSLPTIVNCIVRDNHVSTYTAGGGIFCGVGVIQDCEISDNSSFLGSGGGIYCGAGSIERCIFRRNSSRDVDSSVRGGAISCRSVEITDCVFEGNWTSDPAGAAAGGAISVSPYEGENGSVVRRCMFIGNSVSGRVVNGAAIVLGSGSSTIAACVFSGNTSRGGGATIAGQGTAHAASSTDVRIESCTFVGNTSLESGGTVDGVAGVVLLGTGRVESTIIAFNAGSACAGNGEYSCVDVFGNTLGNLITGTDAGGNQSADPQFCAIDPSGTRDFSLQSDSPCAPPNSGACGLIGASPVGCTAVSIERRSWTSVRELFR